MGFTKIWVAFLAALALFGAACGSDGESVDTEAAAEVAEEVADDVAEAEAEAEAEEVVEEAEEAAEEVVEEAEEAVEEASDPEPAEPAITVVRACLVLRHYSSGLFDSPYEAFITFDTAGEEPLAIYVEHSDEFDAGVFAGGDGFEPGGTVTFPVWAPGPVPLPTLIEVNGIDLTDAIATPHLGGITEFIAEGSDIRDEEIAPIPCEIPFMVIPEGFES